jgi:hypothetical protein
MKTTLLAVLAAMAMATPLAAQPRQPPARTPNVLTAPPVIPNRVYVVEQVVTAKLPAELLKQIEPLKTLRQIEELLKANSIPYAWRKADMNSAALPPEVMQLIDKLPPGEVFVLPMANNLTMNVIVGRR